MIDSRQKFLAIAAHIGYLFFGCGYVLLPLVLYLLYKNSDEFVAGHAKQALTAQGMFGLVCVVGTVLILIRIGVIFCQLLFCCACYGFAARYMHVLGCYAARNITIHCWGGSKEEA